MEVKRMQQNQLPRPRKSKALTSQYFEIHTLLEEIVPYLGDLEVALEDGNGLFVTNHDGSGRFVWGDAKPSQFELPITTIQLRIIQTIRSFLDSAALQRLLNGGLVWDKGEAIAQELHKLLVDGGYCTTLETIAELKRLLQTLKNTKWHI